MWGADGVGGWPGDFAQFMTRDGDAERVWRDELPAGKGAVFARQCRRIVEPNLFKTDGFKVTRVEITLLADGQTWEIETGQTTLCFTEPTAGVWHVVSVDLPPTRGFWLTGTGDEGIYVHKVECFR